MVSSFCLQLMVLDIYTGKIVQIPSLKSSSLSYLPRNPCGIHTIEINPSRTLLVTGAENPNDVAVYKLPTLDPVCVGEVGYNGALWGQNSARVMVVNLPAVKTLVEGAQG